MVHAEGNPAAVEAARRRSALLRTLRHAGVDEDILADVADACEIKEYTVMHLASPGLSVETVAQELYLTEEEAGKLIVACTAECQRLGVTLVEGGELPGPVEDEAGTEDDFAPPASTAESPAPAAEDAAFESVESADEPSVPEAVETESTPSKIDSEPVSPAPSAQPVATPSALTPEASTPEPTSQHGTPEATSGSAPAPPSVSAAQKAPISHPTAVTPTPVKAAKAKSTTPPAPAPTPTTVEAKKSGGMFSALRFGIGKKAAPSPSPAQETPTEGAAPASKKPPMSPVRPQSAPAKYLSKPPTDSKNTPSYARSTTAAMKKVKEEPVVDKSALKARPTSASVHISSSLLRPTAASKGWTTGKVETSRSRLTGSTSDLNTSGLHMHKGPTQPKPFNLRTGTAKASPSMNTEERQMEAAKASMLALKEMKAKLTRPQSAPSKPVEQRKPTEFKPFALSSLSLHEKAKNELGLKAANEAKKEEEARKFRARPVLFDKSKTYTDVVAAVDEQVAKEKRHTVAQDPKFRVNERVEAHKKLDEVKKSKQAEAEAQAAAELKMQQEKEAQELKDIRKSLMFHAAAMPNFSKPFKPDPTVAEPPTVAITPRFESDKRVGRKSVGDGEGQVEVEMINGIQVTSANGAKYFSSTLRSAGVSPMPAEKGKAKDSPAAKEGSAVKNVRVDVKAH